jgi:hypothetical protein
MFVSLDSDDLSGTPADWVGWKIHHGGDDSDKVNFSS